MKLKRGILWLVIIAGATVLAACNQQAPNLSFEETIKAYGDQRSAVLSALDLLADKNALLSSKVNGAINLELGTGEVGKLVVNTTSVTDTKTEDQDSDVDLQLDLSSQEALMGTAVNLTANLGLKALIKEYIPYFQLSKFDLKTDEQLKNQLSFVTSMVDGFKGKWLTLSGANFKDLASQMNAQKFVFTGELMKDKVEYYTGVESVKYEGQPAWKVQFNMDTIRPDAKSLLRSMFSGANLRENQLSGTNVTGNLLFMENEEKLAQMESLIDGMKFENMEAYFVIYAKDNIKFVIKSGDMIIGDQAKISFSQKVTAKNYEGIIKVQPIMTGEVLTGEKQEISFVYTVKDAGKGKFWFEISVLNKEVEQLKLSGTLAFVIEKNALSVKPDVKVVVEGVKASVAGEYRVEKIDSHVFQAPKDAQDIATLLWGMFGGAAISPELLSGDALVK